MLVNDRKDFELIAESRNEHLEGIARDLGRSHIWPDALNAAKEDNDQADDALIQGNHPIRDEWYEIAMFGAMAFSKGLYV